MALSWTMTGKPDGFLICDLSGQLIEATENSYQHYSLIKGYKEEDGFIVNAYVNTQKGKMVVAKTPPVFLEAVPYEICRISLIMPVYNAEDYVARSIDTVKHLQVFPAQGSGGGGRMIGMKHIFLLFCPD